MRILTIIDLCVKTITHCISIENLPLLSLVMWQARWETFKPTSQTLLVFNLAGFTYQLCWTCPDRQHGRLVLSKSCPRKCNIFIMLTRKNLHSKDYTQITWTLKRVYQWANYRSQTFYIILLSYFYSIIIHINLPFFMFSSVWISNVI